MASSSSSPSASTFSSQAWKYHVFLSFRGEDTRKTFVDHLYTALVQQGIYTYKDHGTLPRGESIGPSLMNAIDEAQIAVIVFSKNYADSSWCLDELAYIMKCKDTRGQIVMPIFYDVDPSDVRKQKRKYGEAFAKHALENNNKVEAWKKALVDASNISGWETEHIANGHESKCIKKIVDTISHRLHPVTLSVDDNLVGVEARMQHLISKLQIGFGGKRMIGIWGVGGGGKTTLASSIYDEVSCKFDGSCFVKNIREESSSKNGLEKLQAEILSGVLRKKLVQVGRVEEGRRILKDRLRHKKVLIVLDDVDKLEHLQELAGSRDWFGEGSRIIITTRDEHVLTGHKVDVIHNISLLNNDEAMKLFSKHAPRGHRRIEDYEQLSNDVVSYAGGLPLALTVLGRFLCDKDINEWRSALDRLKDIPDANILEKLTVSFDGLTPMERELFLDIACFFRGRFKDEDVMMTLDACGFHPVIGIKVLMQKALVTLSSDGRFDMHDLIEEMAHYIVRGNHPKNPEEHSRVWKDEDVAKICAMDPSTNPDKIKAICLWYSRSDESRVLQVSANMKKLRLIDLGHYDEMVETLLPLNVMPKTFPPMELCCLKLYGLHAKQLWEGYKYLPNLRMIKVEEMKSLIKTPDFSGVPNLKRLMVDGCPLLEEIHPSFGHLENLVCVVIERCKNLKMLPPINRLKKLETLVLSGCCSLYNHIMLGFSNECIRKLDLRYCSLVDEDIGSSAVWELPNLQELNLAGNRFVLLNFSLLRVRFPRLQYLNLSSCHHIVHLSELPSTLSVLIADNCRSLKSFGDISNCKWLWKVSLRGYNKLDPLCDDKLLHSIFQEIAKDNFISICVTRIDIWRGRSVLWVDWVKTYNMQLPQDWYNYFYGISMFIKSTRKNYDRNLDIIIKLGAHENFQFELGQEFNETRKVFFHDTYVGYVPFSSLRHTGCFNSTYNMISFSLGNANWYGDKYVFKFMLVPKDDAAQLQTTKVTTDYSKFWDEEVNDRKTYTILHDSHSSVKILWTSLPCWYANS